MENKELLKAFLNAKKKVLSKGAFKKDAQAGKASGYGYKYLDLVSILEIIEPILNDNGLFITFSVDENNRFGATLFHCESGQFLYFGYGELPKETKGQSASQSWGMALSYARRYTLLNIFNIVGEEDTDGMPKNGNSYQNSSYSKAPVQQQASSSPQNQGAKYPKIENQNITISSIKIGKKDFKDSKGVLKDIVDISTMEGEKEGLFINSLDSKGERKSELQTMAGAVSQLIQTKQNRTFSFTKEVVKLLNLTKEKKDYFNSKKGNNEIIFMDDFEGVPF